MRFSEVYAKHNRRRARYYRKMKKHEEALSALRAEIAALQQKYDELKRSEPAYPHSSEAIKEIATELLKSLPKGAHCEIGIPTGMNGHVYLGFELLTKGHKEDARKYLGNCILRPVYKHIGSQRIFDSFSIVETEKNPARANKNAEGYADPNDFQAPLIPLKPHMSVKRILTYMMSNERNTVK